MQNSNNIPLIISAIKTCLDKNLIFAAYRFPNEEVSEIVIQESNTLNIVDTQGSYSNLSGFFVAPFSEAECCPSFIINPDIHAIGELDSMQTDKLKQFHANPVISDDSNVPPETCHKDYIEQIGHLVDEIHSGYFEKVVPSRVKVINGQYLNHLPLIFEKLCSSYPNTFVYVFNAGTHLWIGATPEPLLKAQNGSMNTASLAGTRRYNERNLNIGAWNSKERLEQEYVTRYISKVLSKFNLKDVELYGPYAKKAGNLVHLRTDFSFNSRELDEKLGSFLKTLHPTPAVCGMPQKESLELIKELETHHREYYSGYIGPIGLKDNLDLYVNLRCMKVLCGKIALFVGGGITADSIPEDEWQETEIKAETLLSVIDQLNIE